MTAAQKAASTTLLHNMIMFNIYLNSAQIILNKLSSMGISAKQRHEVINYESDIYFDTSQHMAKHISLPLNNLIKFTEHQAGVAAEWLLTCKRRPKMNGFLKAAHGILVFLLILIKNSSGKKREKESYEKIIFCFLAKD